MLAAPVVARVWPSISLDVAAQGRWMLLAFAAPCPSLWTSLGYVEGSLTQESSLLISLMQAQVCFVSLLLYRLHY